MFSPIIAVWNIGPLEIVLFVLVLLLLFGGRLPEVAKSLGKGIVEFKRGLKDVKDDIDEAGDAIGDNDRTGGKPAG